MEADGPGRQRVYVWDPLVRIGHWALVILVTAAWLTRHSASTWHEATGYAALGVISVRVLWGVCGTRYARFADFVYSPRATLRYAGQVFRRREGRFVGHNPLGGWMILALLSTIAVVCASGWLYTTDRFWGIAWVDYLHRGSTYFLLTLVGAHVAGVLVASLRHRENLVAAMLHGRKRATDAVRENPPA